MIATKSTSSSLVLRNTQILRRCLSAQPPAADRLRFVFEEYRQQNYSQELPSRFKKEMVQAMLRRSQRADNRIHLSELQRVLNNIGVTEDQISKQDLQDLFQGQPIVDVQHMIKFL